ncbi:MAG: ribbon-helix-helix domain-containing protein [Rhodospirillaceae bacterium]|nr:ribbon-helix-helix domain-containing protein [Rhodospirillaceae bacterium]
MSLILKRSLKIAGHLTSISLEKEFWNALKAIAKVRNRSVPDLVAEIDRTRSGGLSSAIRVYVLKAAQNGESSMENIRNPTEAS